MYVFSDMIWIVVYTYFTQSKTKNTWNLKLQSSYDSEIVTN